MRWRNWNWLDQLLLPLMMAVMRTCWLTPWLIAIQHVLLLETAAPNTPLNLQATLAPGIILALPLMSFWLARIVTERLPVDEAVNLANQATPHIPTKARLMLAGGGLLAILTVLWWQFARSLFPLWDGRWLITVGQSLIHIERVESLPVWLILIALIFLWMRGLLDAGRTLGHDDVWSAMSSGIAAIIFYLIAVDAFGGILPADFSNWIVLFFAAGMVALAFSGLKVTVGLDWALSGSRRNAKTPPITRYWVISVLLVVGVLLGIGVGIGLLIAPEQISRLLAMLNGVARLLWSLVSTIILAIAYVLFMIVYYIVEFLRPLIERLFGQLQQLDSLLLPPGGEQEQPQQPISAALAAVPDSYRWVALVLFLLIVAVVFAFVVRRLRMAQEVESDEVRESILSSDLLQDQLGKLWDRLFGRRRRAGEIDPYLSLDGETDTRRTIRQLYQQLLSQAGQRGLARQPAQTPHEYRAKLGSELQTAIDPLARMTERYNHARYAPEPPDSEAARTTQQDWREIEEASFKQEATTQPQSKG